MKLSKLFSCEKISWNVSKRGSDFKNELLPWANDIIEKFEAEGLKTPKLFYTPLNGGALSVMYTTSYRKLEQIMEIFNFEIQEGVGTDTILFLKSK